MNHRLPYGPPLEYLQETRSLSFLVAPLPGLDFQVTMEALLRAATVDVWERLDLLHHHYQLEEGHPEINMVTAMMYHSPY